MSVLRYLAGVLPESFPEQGGHVLHRLKPARLRSPSWEDGFRDHAPGPLELRFPYGGMNRITMAA